MTSRDAAFDWPLSTSVSGACVLLGHGGRLSAGSAERSGVFTARPPPPAPTVEPTRDPPPRRLPAPDRSSLGRDQARRLHSGHYGQWWVLEVGGIRKGGAVKRGRRCSPGPSSGVHPSAGFEPWGDRVGTVVGDPHPVPPLEALGAGDRSPLSPQGYCLRSTKVLPRVPSLGTF